jgi:sulfate adenylyltransferase subunit 1 (EFTu-like GTPase family)
MDLVEFNEGAFNQITQQFESFATKLNLEDIQFIPISALHGDNIVNNSLNMPWYSGDTLLQSLETIHIGADENLNDTRFAVKMAINPINVIFIILRIMFVWFNEKSLNMHSKYIIKHATSEVICRFEEINYQIDINTLAEDSENKQIDMNTNFKARITMNMELFTDAYKNNRNTGSIIIITEATNETVAGGMIVWI